jgi:hypothetical protein
MTHTNICNDQTIKEVENLTNEAGNKWLDIWCKGEEVEDIYLTTGNWFLVQLKSGTAISLPHKDSCAGCSFFGNREYLNRHLKAIGFIN